MVRGSNPGGGWDFPHTCPDQLWGPSSLLYNGYWVFPKGKAAGAWRWPHTPSSAKVKERVQLYLYSPSGPLWVVLGWTLPLRLPQLTTKNAKLIPYADYTNIIANNPSPKDFKINMIKACVNINEWLKTNLLSLNYKKPHYLQFRAKNSQEISANISYDNKHITNICSHKYLQCVWASIGLHIYFIWNRSKFK